MDLEFRNITITVGSRIPTNVPPKTIVRGVNGRFLSGQLVAIMGPSGAGKSTLLNAISGYRSAGVTGELLVNGEPRDEAMFHRASCYITQEDLLQPLLSVREAMDVAARLKLPKSSEHTVEQILSQLGLLEHQHTKTDELSGGQKKRLSIALELLNNPPVFFLDEPTSGLDNVTTVQCVKLLRQLAKQGRTVVATIHQPSASLLELFDQVYVIAQGQCIYQGDVDAMVPFLESIGFSCPRHHNPADFIIELTESSKYITALSAAVLNGKVIKSSRSEVEPVQNGSMQLKICYETEEESPETRVMLANEISASVPQYGARRASCSSLSSQLSQISSSLAWMKISKSSANRRGYATTQFTQFTVLLQRMLLQISRNRQGLYIQTIHHIMCGVLIGLCFLNMAEDGREMFNHLKYCVGVTLFFGYTQIMVPVLVYPQEVKLVKKEYFNRWYGLEAYYAALTVSKLPVQLTLNTLFSTIVFLMAGIPYTHERFFVFCVVGNAVSLAAEGMGMAIGSVFNAQNGCAIGPMSLAPFLGLAIYGFDFAHEIPFLMNLLMKTSFLRCGVVAMVLTIFGLGRQPLQCEDIYCFFDKPKILLKFLDVEETSVWFEILLIVVIMAVFRTLCYCGLRWRFAT